MVALLVCEHEHYMYEIMYALCNRDTDGLFGEATTVHTTASGTTDQPYATTAHPTTDRPEQPKTSAGTHLSFHAPYVNHGAHNL